MIAKGRTGKGHLLVKEKKKKHNKSVGSSEETNSDSERQSGAGKESSDESDEVRLFVHILMVCARIYTFICIRAQILVFVHKYTQFCQKRTRRPAKGQKKAPRQY